MTSPELLPEVLAMISKRLTSISDYISFRGVCKSWRSAATFENFDRASPRVPWLMFPVQVPELEKWFTDPFIPCMYVTKFVDLTSQNKTFRIANLPEEKVINYYFSSSGWLLVAEGLKVHVHLTHPITGIRIELPNLDTFPGFKNYSSNLSLFGMPFINKIVLSDSPTVTSDFVIVVIWSKKNQLGFFRSGDSSWTEMEYWSGSFKDILYHNGKLYAIDGNHRVVECDIHGPNPTRIQQISSMNVRSHRFVNEYQCYMVESSGKFLIVSTLHYGGDCRVFEFDLMDGSHEEINDLGNKTLFLSLNSSSWCLEGFAWDNKVKPNCIYFADLNICYQLGDRRWKSIFGKSRPPTVSLPTWVVPVF